MIMKTTRKRNDSHGTEFGSWIRDVERVSSRLGYIATDLDYVWQNYKTGHIMLIEEKRMMGRLTYAQSQTFKELDEFFKSNTMYRGFHLLQFENLSPDDGAIFWDGVQISPDELVDKLQFKDMDQSGYFDTVPNTLDALITS